MAHNPQFVGYSWRFIRQCVFNFIGFAESSQKRPPTGFLPWAAQRSAIQRFVFGPVFPDLIEKAKGASDFPSVVDANDGSFLAPNSMIDAIRNYCKKSGQPVPQTVGEIMQCVYKSLSRCYKDAIEGLSALTGKTYTSVNIVGGGCQDMYLNQMTANATGLPVYVGPVEGTAIGNLIVQMIAGGEFDSLQAARDAIRSSFDIKEVKPL